MDYDAFSESPAGRLIPTTHGQKAFVPNPLPPNLELGDLVSAFGEAMQAVGNLNGIGKHLANPAMVIRPLQRSEALTSSSMEGTHASPDDLVLLEAGAEETTDESAREVHNYIRALDEAEKSLGILPISHRMIKSIHGTLLSGLGKERGAHKHPGEYKTTQNFIGGRRIEEARFIPPPPQETQTAMDELEAYVNRDDNGGLPPLIDAALLHYQFETIHPFADGNGRVGRILIPIFLLERGVLEKPLLYVSPYVEEHKDEYIDLMFQVSARGCWTPWVAFFLRAVRISCEETAETINILRELQATYRDKVHRVTRSVTALRIVDALFEKPVISISDAAAIAEVTYPPAAAAIDKLLEVGILREVRSAKQPRRFIAPEVVLMSARVRRARKVEPPDQQELF
ncbi:Fic family protein [Afifella pfennigii]|uniref:Fic family protein n=1 Tax=Afifella pfennigii TaxID=209897 RepID=UPI00068C4F09|nr:Fic family protein [Afifella pfennigii]